MSVRLTQWPLPKCWVLDANILFSPWCRVWVQTLAHHAGATLAWTSVIEEECYRNLVRLGRLHADDAQAERLSLASRCSAQVLPPERVEPYKADVRAVDDKDRHVAAAALSLKHARAEPVALLTWNIRDFPKRPLAKLGVLRFSPDELPGELGLEGSLLMQLLDRSAKNLQAELLAYPHANPTNYQAQARPLPHSSEEWAAFLQRNRLHLTAKRAGICIL